MTETEIEALYDSISALPATERRNATIDFIGNFGMSNFIKMTELKDKNDSTEDQLVEKPGSLWGKPPPEKEGARLRRYQSIKEPPTDTEGPFCEECHERSEDCNCDSDEEDHDHCDDCGNCLECGECTCDD